MWSVRVGADLLRRLREAGVGASTIDRLRDEFKPAVPDDLRPVDRLLCRRGADGLAIAAASAAGKLEVPQSTRRVVDAWRAELDAQREVGAASDELSTWDPEHQEYQFHLTAGDEKPTLILDAPEYHGRRADWYSFDVKRNDAFDEFLAKRRANVDEVLASPIDFAGTPASRWWAIEDDEVSMAHLDGTDVDLARAIVAGFITTFGSDWLMAPIAARLGDLVEISKVEVVDSFGDRHEIPPMAHRDAKTDSRRPWKFFELTGDSGPAAGRAPLVYVTPTAADVMAGPDLERVVLAHDELSNLGWAIEEVVESVYGRPLDRTVRPDDIESDERSRSSTAKPAMRYRLDPEVPEHWLPLVPVTRTGDSLRWRQRGRVTPPVGADDDWGEAQGLLLEPDTRLLLHEEEIPRSGAVVVRRTRASRQHDGTPVVWVGRRKRLGNARPSGVYLPDQIICTPGDPTDDPDR